MSGLAAMYATRSTLPSQTRKPPSYTPGIRSVVEDALVVSAETNCSFSVTRSSSTLRKVRPDIESCVDGTLMSTVA